MGLLQVEVALLVLLTGSHGMSATCMKQEEHIQRYLISSQPPYDNYYNISKAVYPSVDLPSLLIKITVTFLHGDVPFLFRPPPMDEYPQKTASRNPFSKGPTKRSKGSDKKVRW